MERLKAIVPNLMRVAYLRGEATYTSVETLKIEDEILQSTSTLRREFIALIGGATGWPLAACGPQPSKIRTVAVLWLAAGGKPLATAEALGRSTSILLGPKVMTQSA